MPSLEHGKAEQFLNIVLSLVDYHIQILRQRPVVEI